MRVPDNKGLALSFVEALFYRDVGDALKILDRLSFVVGWQDDLPHAVGGDEEVGDKGQLFNDLIEGSEVGFGDGLSAPG